MTSILINPNIATIQTDNKFADKVYLLPINRNFVEQVIENERPDSIMLSYGGQTALNCGVDLYENDVLRKYGVNVLNTSIDGIKITEDRQKFKDAMINSNVPVLDSATAYTYEEALQISKQIGFPVIIRVAYTLGGRGGGVAYNEFDLHEIVHRGLSLSMVHQVLIEKYVGEWKQIEYEVMRDSQGNSVIVCNMENVLGMKVHTGDNIVVAPSQTLNNHEYHMLRDAALRATSYCGINGECNIQFGLNPKSEEYCAIEINARLSRSSALASKATGYPLAYMAAKIGLGYTLPELVNKITKVTSACFEPALDYMVVKMPRWDFKKFELVKRKLGSAMKSVGEVMAIGKNFEEVIQKAIRMCEIGKDGLVCNLEDENEFYLRKRKSDDVTDHIDPSVIEKIEYSLIHPDDEIIFNVVRAIKFGMSIEHISNLSSIDPWFLMKIKNIVDKEEQLKKANLNIGLLKEVKKLGFSDKQIGRCWSLSEDQVRELRNKLGILPVIKQIDTLAAEWPAKTNYLYLTYNGSYDDISFPKDNQTNAIIVLGAGPYRIGSSVEFDWATVNMVYGLRSNKIDNLAIINCNPETVSTDYDVPDRLYFEEMTLERVLDIYEKENPRGLVACVGGQSANNLVARLTKHKVNILGTSSFDVDKAEDRSKFSKLLDDLGIKQPPWKAFTSLNDSKNFALNQGYPVLVRPSYVLSGAAMKVVWSEKQLEQFIMEASSISPDYPIVISKFLEDASEVEVDAVGSTDRVVIGSIIEHIDNAGIHSGDAMMCIPPWRLNRETMDTLIEYTLKIGKALNVKGPLNIQYLVKDNEVYVIEANVRASRSMPFVSKFYDLNLIELASKAILDIRLPDIDNEHWLKKSGFGIKVPQFSFMQLEGADIMLGVEMQSTGEVACFGNTFYDALSKSYLAAGYSLPTGGSALITIGGVKNKEKLFPIVSLISSLGFKILATEHTAEFFIKSGLEGVELVHKISEPERHPNILNLLTERKINFIINVPSTSTIEKYVGMLDDEYQIRRKSVEMGIPVLTTVESTISFVKTLEWIRTNKPTVRPVRDY
ncbi:carbamoyl-phosphate synthase (glutamine-hydrolyzing) large subunit [Candidatus Nitrosocosmicus franklandus]|uniref:carbamoyl-phosphate synthase (glutamine-hydrolyzing) large subunit n=1 Tax=Candidatus Nitrosocosmicus franklandianus TaxID=1798806 RepID=UPI001E564D7F